MKNRVKGEMGEEKNTSSQSCIILVLYIPSLLLFLSYPITPKQSPSQYPSSSQVSTQASHL